MYHNIFEDDFQIEDDFQTTARMWSWSQSNQWQKSHFLHDLLNGASEILELHILWLKGTVQIQHLWALQRHDPMKKWWKMPILKTNNPIYNDTKGKVENSVLNTDTCHLQNLSTAWNKYLWEFGKFWSLIFSSFASILLTGRAVQ